MTLGGYPVGGDPIGAWPDRAWPSLPEAPVVVERSIGTLFTAIYSRYVASSLSALLSGMYHTQAPADAVFPYATLSLISPRPEWTFTENFENCLIQFSLFNNESSPSDAGDEVELLKELYDFFDLLITYFLTVKFVRETVHMLRIERVWQHVVTYRILIEND